MPATGQVQSQSSLDTIAATATCQINGQATGPYSRVTKIKLGFGEEPSEATVYIPLKQIDDFAPAVAGVSDSPVLAFKEGDPATITGQIQIGGDTVQVMAGTVVDIQPDIETDTAIITILDMRYLLEGVMIVGSWWLDEDGSGKISYRQGVKGIYNPGTNASGLGGVPNAIWVTVSGWDEQIPVFVTPFYGVEDNVITNSPDSIPDSSAQSTKTACYWTNRMAIQLMRFHTSTVAQAMARKNFPEYSAVPTQLIWPASVVSALDEMDVATGTKKMRSTYYHCHNLINALKEVCETGGPFEPSINNNLDSTSTLAIVRTRYQGGGNGVTPSPSANQGVDLVRATGGFAQNELTFGGNFNKGRLKESARSLFTLVMTVGDKPKFEVRLSSSQGNDQGEDDPGATMLWGWSKDDYNNAKADLLNALNNQGMWPNSVNDAIFSMFKKYNRLFSCWTVTPPSEDDPSFLAGTLYYKNNQANGRTVRLAKTHRVPLPKLLTSYLNTDTTSDLFALIQSRRKVPLEVNFTANDETAWTTVPENFGLELDGDGTINLTALRQSTVDGANPSQGTLYSIVVIADPSDPSGNTAKIETFAPARIRMTLVLPIDEAVTQSIKLTGDPTPGVNIIQPNELDTDDNDRISPGFNRTVAIENDNYSYEERGGLYQSFPIPQSLHQVAGPKNANTNAGLPYPPAGDPTNAAGVALYGSAEILRDDVAECLDHSKRRARQLMRLDRGGNLSSPHVWFTITPGTMINNLNNSGGGKYPVKSVVKYVTITFDKPQTVALALV